ncbi:MAG: response regulator [bacterium]|nr:response regulator [bacterium]
METKGNILIADDSRETREPLTYFFEMAGYKIFGSCTIDDTIQLLKKEKIDVAILDTCDRQGSAVGLIKVLKFIEKGSPTTRAIIYSVSANIYARQVEQFKVVQACISKPSYFKDLKKIVQQSMLQREVPPPKKRRTLSTGITIGSKVITDPFDIHPSIFVGKLDFETYDKLYTAVYEKYGEQINQKIIETGAKTFIVYKDNGKVRVAGKSNSPYYPSDDELEKIQQKVAKVCYVVGRDVIEESKCIEKSKWTSIPQIPENPYPTIPIYLGRLDEECKNILRKDRLIIADFDTGNHNILAFKDEYRENLQIPSGQRRKKSIEYISGGGEYYDYSVGRVKIGLCDTKDDKKFCCTKFDVLFVLNWQISPFTTTQSPLRNAFVGRALWLPDKLRFSLILNAKDEKVMFSQVEL